MRWAGGLVYRFSLGGVFMDDAKSETFSDAETERRANAALKRMLGSPPKLHKDSKLGRRKAD
jgi:hypothetical protein